MTSYGFHILLKDEASAVKYKKYHENVWSEITLALEQIGIKKMRIFFTEPLKLFMYIEAIDGFDPTKDFDKAEAMSPRVKEWCHIMNNSLLQRLNEEEGSLVWKLMDDVYHFEHP